MKTRIRFVHFLVLAALLAAVSGGPAARLVTPSAAAVPQAVQGTLSAALGAEDAAYRVAGAGLEYRAANTRQGLNAAMGPQGLAVRTASGVWQLRLAGWGRAADRQEAAPGTATAQANRVEIKRGGVVEWWVNGPLGLEQGWDVAKPPSAESQGPLTLFLAQSGSLQARAGADQKTLMIADGAGLDVLRYAGLAAWDAAGRDLPARFETAGDELRVVVDDTQAAYPIRIDPWVQSASLTASDGAASDALGTSVAVSADGSTVVVGANYKLIGSNNHQGAAYVFTKPALGWASAASAVRLTASDGAANDYLGNSVAVNGNGSLVVVGASSKKMGANSYHGQVYLYVKPASGGWVSATETARLTASDATAIDMLGSSVAVSTDGLTVAASSPHKAMGGKNDQGQVYVYVKPPSGGWKNATEKARLTASDGAEDDSLGSSLAISGDGLTLAAGAWGKQVGAHGGQGAVYIFAKPASGGWVSGIEKARLTGSDGNDSDFMGQAVAISADGTTVAAGAPNKFFGTSYFQGEAYVFVKPASGWANGTEKARLSISTGAEFDALGQSVAVSGDGAMVAVGASGRKVGSNTNQGAAYVYIKPAAGWANSTQSAALTASDGAAYDKLGTSIAMNGSAIFTGSSAKQVSGKAGQGTVYVFQSPRFKQYLPRMMKQ